MTRNYCINLQSFFPKEGTKDRGKGICYRTEEADSKKIKRVEREESGIKREKVVSSCERGCVVCGRVQGAR